MQITLVANPQTVQISTRYGQQPEGAKALSRNKYVEIKTDKPTPQQAKWPEYKTCRYIKEALITDGIDKGKVRKVCANADCVIHNPKKVQAKQDAAYKADQQKRRR